MDQAFIDAQRATLQKEQEGLQEQLDTVSSADTGDHVAGDRAPKFPNYGDDNYGENSESPSEVSDYSVNVDVTGKLGARLQEVKAALQAIEDGTYGTCSNCQGEIAEGRLQANAAATTCMDCARQHGS